MTIIAVAGGSGHLGRAITEALVAGGLYQVLILARSVDEEKQKAIGATFIPVDYTDVDSLTKVLEENKVETVVSTISGMGDVQPELNLIKASDKSTLTKRYIPSIWGTPLTDEIAKYFPPGKDKIAVIKALAATSLGYTTIYNGFFSDYFVAPQVKTYMNPMALVLDIPNDFAAIPGSGDVPVTFTHTFDIAKYVVALQSLPKWEKESFIIGDKVTLNEFVRLAEQAKGKKFTVVHDSLEKLRSGRITELPSHPAMYPFFPKPMLQGFFAAFGIMFEQGAFDLDVRGSLTERFPEIKPRKIKALLEEAYGRT